VALLSLPIVRMRDNTVNLSSLQQLNTATPAARPGGHIQCYFLADRRLYQTCHIQDPDHPHRLAAVTFEREFFSFFRRMDDATKLVAMLTKLSRRGDDKAAVTFTPKGYVLWVHESNAVLVPSQGQPQRHLQAPPVGPAFCHVVTSVDDCRFCSISVPDINQPLPGIAYRNSLYSIYKQDGSGENVLALASKLAQRGDETLLVMKGGDYVLGVKEPIGYLS